MMGFKLETLVDNLKGKSVATFLEKKFGQKIKTAFLDSTPRQLIACGRIGEPRPGTR